MSTRGDSGINKNVTGDGGNNNSAGAQFIAPMKNHDKNHQFSRDIVCSGKSCNFIFHISAITVWIIL